MNEIQKGDSSAQKSTTHSRPSLVVPTGGDAGSNGPELNDGGGGFNQWPETSHHWWWWYASCMNKLGDGEKKRVDGKER
ncbi:hypothetical protein E3N88_07746 [Mikania micrantha]|uniref:Uncharacterized protein n=1 Tax=Mikania micrantha TaxID=192012 RepID=A0A5N6PG95_9ASTR|nr:hypothetical protein E3N88_07746 [Mikania micrantha]